MPQQQESAEQDTLVLDAHDVARELRVTRETVYQLWAGGSLPSFKVGRLRRMKRSDLVAYIDNLAAPGTSLGS